MENTNRLGVSSSSFTLDLFGPKESSPSAAGLFGSVFGPQSTGLGKDSSHAGSVGSLRKQDLGIQYGNAKQHGTPGNITDKKNKGESSSAKHSKDRRSNYQNDTVDSCYFSSSIYYGGQETYYPNGQNNGYQHTFKRAGGEDDQNGSNLNDASRGDWWQGSLYY